MGPLSDLLVLDFSTLLPGPMATLVMADAGADVVKIERAGTGDDMRGYEPAIEGASVNFTMLNRGKSSIEIDLKAPGSLARLRPLLEKADVLVEQFRPGVMDRLGLGYEDVKSLNPDIIYCSISGWGQTGPKAHLPGHDINYMAETGVLGLSVGADGAPVLPPVLAADIAGGAYPAMINILLALRRRDQSGKGCWIDISMGENLFPFVYWALGNLNAVGRGPIPGGETVTGGTPRYQIYRTRDNKFIAAAPLEDKFWKNFTTVVGLPAALCDDTKDPIRTQAAIAEIVASRDAAEWASAFAGKDVCCSCVMELSDAVQDPHWAARKTFSRLVTRGNMTLPALPSILAPELRDPAAATSAPHLGEHDARLAD
ncbi:MULTISPECIES: CoA transferase [Chelativorans]|uniref:CoA transferase n=1 Tax=Chelativorans TaxID=449972 RepID=UPI00059EE830